MDRSDLTSLIADSAEKILSDFCDKKLLDQSEAGVFAQELWDEICLLYTSPSPRDRG